MRKFLILILLLSMIKLGAQSPYALDWKKDAIISGTGLALLGADLLINSAVKPLSTSEIQNLNAQDIHRFDRWATEQNSESAAQRSDFGLYGSALLGASSTLLFPLKSENSSNFMQDFSILAVIFLETNVINVTGTNIIKGTVKRTRPYVYNPLVSMDKKMEEDARKSYISGHTSASVANAFFFAKVFSDYYPESKWKPLVWGGAIALPAWTGLERVLAGKHFPSDVISGYLFGAACGYFIPHLHKRHKKRKEQNQGLSFHASPYSSALGSGMQLQIRF